MKAQRVQAKTKVDYPHLVQGVPGTAQKFMRMVPVLRITYIGQASTHAPLLIQVNKPIGDKEEEGLGRPGLIDRLEIISLVFQGAEYRGQKIDVQRRSPQAK